MRCLGPNLGSKSGWYGDGWLGLREGDDSRLQQGWRAERACGEPKLGGKRSTDGLR